jgi:hypothetical protein
MTKIADRTNLLVHEFATKRKLLEALQASSFIPVVSGWRLPCFRGDLVLDGCYSDNLPVFDASTITVSPFAGDASICPVDDSLLNLRIPHGPTNSSNSITLSKGNSMKMINALVPPGVDGMMQLCNQGYTDAIHFLTTGGYIHCPRCKDVIKAEASTEPEERDLEVPEQPEECADCEAARREAAAEQGLPADIRAVFREAAGHEGARQGVARQVACLLIRPGVVRLALGLLIHAASAPLRIGVSLGSRPQLRVARLVASMAMPTFFGYMTTM